MDSISILEAREELRELRARYWRFVDTKQFDQFADLFTDDGVLEEHALAVRMEGREQIRKMIPEALDGVVSIHHGHQSEIRIDDPGHASGIWSMEDYLVNPPSQGLSGLPSVLRGYGYYLDEYVAVDGRWLFKQVHIHRLRVETTTDFATVLPKSLLQF